MVDSDQESLPPNNVIGAPLPFWHRFLGKDRPRISWKDSASAIFFSSWLNALLILIPIAWVSHFKEWTHGLTFGLCFLSIIPLEKLFDWGGEQLAMYCGEDLGDLIVITLNNTVEATLAIILLARCELKLLQSTIAGVVLLHLLLIPGTTFLTGGVRIREQLLHPDRSQLNLTLLTVGVLALTIPAAFFASVNTSNANGVEAGGFTGPSDTLRRDMLRMSRGFAVILLTIYICSRIYLHNPPPADSDAPKDVDNQNGGTTRPEPPRRRKSTATQYGPQVNPRACLLLLAVTVALMGVTAEFLVDSIEFVRNQANIEEEWFGIVLLPLVSFSADGTVAIVFFIRSSLRRFFTAPEPPEAIAEGRAIDLSIQFLLFWTPFVTLLGWWLNKPVSLLFDLFEVTLLIGACFLVNYVTADAKTNWAEGFVLVSFYAMIGLSAWYYTGQSEVRLMDACRSVAAAITDGVSPGQ
ncbi:hypothetical protein BJV78DRAFT_1276542 [Lactifluus subvellereus]|nr:hypothetical protein BJV78DRAFT_1276542 [Lactifluus subvellereus]